MLQHGFYAVEWESHRWLDLVQKLMREGKLNVQPERMGLISLLRKVQKREPLPKAILVLNLDRAMYDAFWLNGGEAKPDEALKAVRRIVSSFGQTLAQNRDWLNRQFSIVLLLVSSLEHRADGWWVGFRFAAGNVQPLFQMGWLVSNPAMLEPMEIVQGVRGCFAPF